MSESQKPVQANPAALPLAASKLSKGASRANASHPVPAIAELAASQLEAKNGSRTRRTGNQQHRERNEAEATQRWKERAAPSVQLSLDKTLPGFKSLDSKAGSEVVDIFIGAGKSTGFVLDESRGVLELDTDRSHAHAPKTSTLAHASRDLIAKQLGRPVIAISLKAVFLLDEKTALASPSWRIRFDRVGIAAGAMPSLERGLGSLLQLVASDTDSIWLRPAEEILPGEDACELIVEAAKAIRVAAGGKSIAADCMVSSSDFRAPIRVPLKVGAKPELEDSAAMEDDPGEVVGYDRRRRLVFVEFERGQTSVALRADMAVFFDFVKQVAAMPDNRCRIWHQPEEAPTEGVRRKLLRLELLSNGLFAQVPEFSLPAAGGEASIS